MKIKTHIGKEKEDENDEKIKKERDKTSQKNNIVDNDGSNTDMRYANDLQCNGDRNGDKY